MIYRYKLNCTAAVAALLFSSSAAFAQGDVGGDGVTNIDEVVVTAEHRESTVQKTAAAISVRSGDELRSEGRFTLEDVVQNVPGTNFGTAALARANSNRGTDSPAADLIFRGIRSNAGPGTSLTSTATSAALYVDGVYNGIGGGFDIDRVEVLRGPQGTLYGRSATSGVMSVTTKAPDATDFTGDLAVEAGNYNLRHVAGGLNVPIVTDKVALRVSGNYHVRDGFDASNGGGRISTTNGRAKLLVQPTENLKAVFAVAAEDIKSRTPGVTINQGPQADQFSFVKNDWTPGVNKSRQYWAMVDYDFGDVALTYIPAFRTWTQDVVTKPRGFRNVDAVAKTLKDEFLTQEVRLRSDKESPLQWQTGVTYYNNKVNDFNESKQVTASGAFIALASRSKTDKETTQAGAFAEATYSLSDATRLTGGLRYDYTKVSTVQQFDTATTTVFLRGAAGEREFNNVNYKIRLEHDFTPENMAYASIGTGFSPGDVTTTLGAGNVPVVLEFKAETLTSYEVGSKNRFADGRLQVNGALFYYTYDGFQQANINVDVGVPLAKFDRIVRPLRAYGAELEVEAKPWDNGHLSANLSYIHLRQHDLPKYDSLFSTDEIEGVPAFSGNVTLGQDFPLSADVDLTLAGTLRYTSDYFATFVPDVYVPFGATAFARVDPQTTVDLNATLSFANGDLSITGYLRNVTDERYKTFGLTQINSAAASGVASTVSLSSPRTWGLVVTGRF